MNEEERQQHQRNVDRQNKAAANAGMGFAGEDQVAAWQANAYRHAQAFHAIGCALGTAWSEANAAAVLITGAFDMMREKDEALALEFLEVFAAGMRSVHRPESAEHIAANERLGSLMVELLEIEQQDFVRQRHG